MVFFIDEARSRHLPPPPPRLLTNVNKKMKLKASLRVTVAHHSNSMRQLRVNVGHLRHRKSP